MLFSLRQKYIFLSNPKCASTSFEQAFQDDVELPLHHGALFGRHPVSNTPLKHLSSEDLQRNFSRFFNEMVPRDRFFIFGFVRDPLERLHSFFHYARRDKSPIQHLFKDMDFEKYLRKLIQQEGGHNPNFSPGRQYDFFSIDDELSVNFLCRLDRLDQAIEVIYDTLGLDFRSVLSTRKNASENTVHAKIDNKIIDDIMSLYADDFSLYEYHTNCMLRYPANWNSESLDAERILRWMLVNSNPFDIAAAVACRLQQRIRNGQDVQLNDFLRLTA